MVYNSDCAQTPVGSIGFVWKQETMSIVMCYPRIVDYSKKINKAKRLLRHLAVLYNYHSVLEKNDPDF